uniref:Uncharacterized protein n=1 Tax=Acrobeloides nanus TaxID=290746 RepID=A0A914D1H5_9BILA
MAFKEIIILLVALFSVGIAIVCQTCQEGYCGNGGISEPCPDDIELCYVLTNGQNYVIRAGCLFQSCAAILRQNPSSQCQECYGDNCNWPSNSNQPGIGGGVTVNSSNSLTIMISFLSVLISAFVILV